MSDLEAVIDDFIERMRQLLGNPPTQDDFTLAGPGEDE